jgi:hypothetical protein
MDDCCNNQKVGVTNSTNQRHKLELMVKVVRKSEVSHGRLLQQPKGRCYEHDQSATQDGVDDEGGEEVGSITWTSAATPKR